MIRIENPRIAKFVAEYALKIALKHGQRVEDDIEDNHVFVGWRLGVLFVCEGSDYGQHYITAYTENGADGFFTDLFFVSYHFPKWDDESGDGLLTIGRSPMAGWDFGGGVDDPRY